MTTGSITTDQRKLKEKRQEGLPEDNLKKNVHHFHASTREDSVRRTFSKGGLSTLPRSVSAFFYHIQRISPASISSPTVPDFSSTSLGDSREDNMMTRRDHEDVDFTRYRVKNNSELTNFGKSTRIEWHNGK